MLKIVVLSLTVALLAILIHIHNNITLLNEKIEILSEIAKDRNFVNSKLTNEIKNVTIYSLNSDISIFDMLSQGYQVAYDVPYSHATTLSELYDIKMKCNSQSIICVGGALKDSNKILLVSCGNCHSILSPTPLNQPVLINGAYWYMTDYRSFGFSPIYAIQQRYADAYDCSGIQLVENCTDSKRLSWGLWGDCGSDPGKGGGYRLGKLTPTTVERFYENYRKILLVQ